MRKLKLSAMDRVFNSVNALLMLIIAVIMVYPFIYVFAYSFSEPARIGGGIVLIPKGFNIDAYVQAFSNRNIVNGIFISVLRTIIGPITLIIITSMAAFAISKPNLPGVKIFRKIFVLTMYFHAGIIPVYLLIKGLNLIGTFSVYIIPYMSNAFFMILIKTYMENLPSSLEEAAVIDGANDFVLFSRVVFPLCKPIIVAVLLFAGVGQWNMFMDTQLYNAMKTELFPLQYVLYQFLQGAIVSSREQAVELSRSSKVSSKTLKMAITVINILPVIIIYPFVQKHFASGLMIGSIKG